MQIFSPACSFSCMRIQCFIVFSAGVYAYITLKDHVTQPVDEIIGELKSLVKKQIAGYAVPEMIQVLWGNLKWLIYRILPEIRTALNKVRFKKNRDALLT